MVPDVVGRTSVDRNCRCGCEGNCRRTGVGYLNLCELDLIRGLNRYEGGYFSLNVRAVYLTLDLLPEKTAVKSYFIFLGSELSRIGGR